MNGLPLGIDALHWAKLELTYKGGSSGFVTVEQFTHQPSGRREYFFVRDGEWVHLLDYSRDGRVLSPGGSEFYHLVE